MVVFIIRSFVPGDYLKISGEEFTVSRISLLTTSGYTPEGIFVNFPNQNFLVTACKNYGKSRPSRVKLLFRARIEDPYAASDVMTKLGQEMRLYCKSKRDVYLHKTFACWAEPFDPTTLTDDLTLISFGLQVGLTSVTENASADLKAVKTEFVNKVRAVAANLRVFGTGVRKLDLVMDNSIVGNLPRM